MENLARQAVLCGTLVFKNKAADKVLWALGHVFALSRPAGFAANEITVWRSGAYDRDAVTQALGDAAPYLLAGKVDGMDEEGSMWRLLFLPERNRWVMRGVCRFADAYDILPEKDAGYLRELLTADGTEQSLRIREELFGQ